MWLKENPSRIKLLPVIFNIGLFRILEAEKITPCGVSDLILIGNFSDPCNGTSKDQSL